MAKKEVYICKRCGKDIEGNPKHAIIRSDFPVFCSQECLELFNKIEKEKKE